MEQKNNDTSSAWWNPLNIEAEAARRALTLDKRESAQVTHALAYSAQYAAAGEPGHSHLMLIAKLASALGVNR